VLKTVMSRFWIKTKRYNKESNYEQDDKKRKQR